MRALAKALLDEVLHLWTGLDWTGLDWTGLDWTGLDWTGLDWTGLDWTGLDWTGLDWAYYCPCAQFAQKQRWTIAHVA
jgi:hypothetical protein